MQRESKEEARLVAWVERAGGLCLKLDSSARRNVPDRVVVFPQHGKRLARVCLVEMKSATGRESPGQQACRNAAKRVGFPWIVAHGFDEAREQLIEVCQVTRAKARNASISTARRLLDAAGLTELKAMDTWTKRMARLPELRAAARYALKAPK